jgi:hypothetical protein
MQKPGALTHGKHLQHPEMDMQRETPNPEYVVLNSVSGKPRELHTTCCDWYYQGMSNGDQDQRGKLSGYLTDQAMHVNITTSQHPRPLCPDGR